MKVNTVVDGKGCANHEPVVGDRGRRLLDLIGLVQQLGPCRKKPPRERPYLNRHWWSGRIDRDVERIKLKELGKFPQYLRKNGDFSEGNL